MGRISLSRKNINRFVKTYPFVIRTPRYVYETNEMFAVEGGQVGFEGSDTVVYNFKNTYTSIPNVVATSMDDSFNVAITGISLTSATIVASIPNNAYASVMVLSS